MEFAFSAPHFLADVQKIGVLADQVGMMISLADSEYFLYLNKTWEKVLGWKVSELTASPYRHFIHPDDVVPSLNAFRQSERGSARPRFRNRYRHCDGTYRHIEWIGKVVDGVGFAFSQDVTKWVEMDHRLQAVRGELASAEKVASLGALSASMAHEINNPLAILGGKVALLKRLIDTGRFERELFMQELDKMENTVSRMASIVGSLRNYSIKEVESHSHWADDVVGLLEAVVEMHQLRIEEIGAEVLWHLPQVKIPLERAHTPLFQVFSNLLINALDAVQAVKLRQITIDVALGEDRVRVGVTDTGIGVLADSRDRIFDFFFTTKGDRGTGIGLSISRQLVEQLGGHLSLDPHSPETRFVVDLPLTRISHFSKIAEAQKAKILLVEDEVELANTLRFFLEEEGVSVTLCHTGRAALERLAAEQFNVVLCDFRLPDLNGGEILRRSATDPKLRQWIFLTGYMDVHQTCWNDSRVARVLHKPVDHRELAQAVETVLKELREGH